MIAVNAAFLATLLASALWLVQVQYESRRSFAELENAQTTKRRLDADVQRLHAEVRAQATAARIERVAKAQLQMRAADPAVTHYVSEATPGGAK